MGRGLTASCLEHLLLAGWPGNSMCVICAFQRNIDVIVRLRVRLSVCVSGRVRILGLSSARRDLVSQAF